MGEFADAAIEAALDAEEFYYLNPEEDDWDWFSGRSNFKRRSPPTCKFCGQQNLVWKKLPTGWRLHEFNEKTLYTPITEFHEDEELIIHTCKYKDAFNGRVR